MAPNIDPASLPGMLRIFLLEYRNEETLYSDDRQGNELHILAEIHSLLPRCCTAMGFYTRISLVDPTKVKARKSFLFTEKLCCIENKEHLFLFVITHQTNMFNIVNLY